VRGQRGWVIDKVEPTDTAQLVERFLTQFYGEQAALAESSDDAHQPVPKGDHRPGAARRGGLADRVAVRAARLRGAIRVPQRGDKRALAETVARNAAEALTQHKLRRAGDLTARSAALAEIQDALGLDSAPLRIECIDVSHVQGTNVVASLVVFEDGLARKSEYRRFEIRGRRGGRRRRLDRRGRAPAVPPLPRRDGDGGARRSRAIRGGNATAASADPVTPPT
jgi:excinuclease ABC subunit C